MKCTVHDFGSLSAPDGQSGYKYVVTFARYEDKWLLCKHKNRNTWETSGGHIEPEETPLEAAKRELREETGAADFTIEPVCDYRTAAEPHDPASGTTATGQVFLARLTRTGEIPSGSEMERTALFDDFPDELTYFAITRDLLPRVLARLAENAPAQSNDD